MLLQTLTWLQHCYEMQYFGLNIFHSSQDVIKDRVERKAMFSILQIMNVMQYFGSAITIIKVVALPRYGYGMTE